MMKGMKGRILKKLQSTIPHVSYLKYDQTPPPPSRCWTLPGSENRDLTPREAIDVAELITDLEDGEIGGLIEDKENTRPASPARDNSASWMMMKKNQETLIQSEHKNYGSSYRRPDPNSATLFDPDLLAAFEKALMEHIKSLEEAKRKAMELIEGEEEEELLMAQEPRLKVPRTDEGKEDDNQSADPLTEFEGRCPPGGKDGVVLYTTTLRGIRKTFEDCNSVRFLLGSLKVKFSERDVSMHMEFREEMWRVLGGRSIPPRLFIRGRYIGGADQVLGLHEQGRLLPLLRGMPAAGADGGGGEVCEGCGGMRFVVCSDCNGSHKVYDDENGVFIRCQHCNENGLILCRICC